MYEHSSLFSFTESQYVDKLLLEIIHQPSKSSLVAILCETYLSTNDAVILHDIDPYYITITVPDHQIPIYIYPQSLTLSLFTPPQTLRVFTCKNLDIDHEFIASVLENEWDMKEYQCEFDEIEREKRSEEKSNEEKSNEEKASEELEATSSMWTMSHSDSTATVVTVNEMPRRSLLRTVSARTIQTAPPHLTRSCSMVSSVSSRTRKPTWK